MPTANQSRQREIRVFISSTFRDMQAERNELVKRIFPQLRKLCESRGVTWGEVDLRWGVTDEQRAEGKVLPICLEEIRRCRPYFIGLLGERYGWVPDEVPPELIEREPWLAEHRGHSVTELEILHGVLNNPQMADHAFFYFRDPSYVNSLPHGITEDFEETPTAGQIKDLGLEQAKLRAEERKQKLRVLKQGIRVSALPVRENYADPQTLGRLVLEDLTSIINRLFPEGSQPDSLDREAAEHEAFARSRTGVYIGRQEYFAALDAHAAGEDPPLAVLGESGLGKSALLANWAMRYRAAYPDELFIMHFIGATPASTDWAAMVRRILGEFNRRFNLNVEIPDKPDALRMTFANALFMAGTKGRVILILDALNQLEDRDQAPDLVWLPPALPPDVRLIVSTLPGRALEDLKRRGWPTMQVEPLNTEERKRLIVDYLAQYTHALSPERVQQIAGASQAANPLYLRALLEELRLWGDHQTLPLRIEHYLSAATVPDLYQKILERYEQDYERERPGLVRDAMTLLWAARRGLSEAEFMDLLGSNDQPLPRAYWSPLYLAAEQALVSRSGLIGFFHDYLRQAVQDAYMHTAGRRQRAHRTLALYFGSQPQGPRQLDELPWQWQEAGEWRSLAELLAQPGFFDTLWDKNEFDGKAYWTRIEQESLLRMEQVYAAVIEQPAQDPDHAWRVGQLLDDTGKPEPALRVRGALVEHYRERGDLGKLQGALSNQAVILKRRGDLDEAMALYKEVERLCRELDDKLVLSISLGNQALILKARGDLDGAMALHKEQERLCREVGNKDGLLGSLNNQAVMLYDSGDLDGAMALHKEAERLCREVGNKAWLQTSVLNQANILAARRDLDGAMALYKEQERICRELGNKDGLQGSLCNQAVILYSRGDPDGSMALLKEAERLCRELGNKDRLQATLRNQAVILRDRADLDGAMALHKETERLCRELDNPHGLSISLANQASLLSTRQGRAREARQLAEEALALATRHGYRQLVPEIQGLCDPDSSRWLLRSWRIAGAIGVILALVAGWKYPQFDSKMPFFSQPHWGLLALIWMTNPRALAVYYGFCAKPAISGWFNLIVLGVALFPGAWGLYFMPGLSASASLRWWLALAGLFRDALNCRMLLTRRQNSSDKVAGATNQSGVTLEKAKKMCAPSTGSVVLLLGCVAAGAFAGHQLLGHWGYYVGGAAGCAVGTLIEARLIVNRARLSAGILMMCYGMRSGTAVEPLVNRALSAYRSLRNAPGYSWLRQAAEGPSKELLKGLNILAVAGATPDELRAPALQLLAELEAIASNPGDPHSSLATAQRLAKLHLRASSFSQDAMQWAVAATRQGH